MTRKIIAMSALAVVCVFFAGWGVGDLTNRGLCGSAAVVRTYQDDDQADTTDTMCSDGRVAFVRYDRWRPAAPLAASPRP